jgi:HD-GYP domain-containing protein (c-di-GMP phosphodiesterase class II)
MRDKAALYYNKWDQNESYNVDEVLNLKQQHILNLFDYDVSIVMLFNESLNIAITKAVYISKQNDNLLEIPKAIFINKTRHSPIRKLLESMVVVENHSKDFRLIREMESELYIPLFEPIFLNGQYKKLEGFIYLGSTAYKEISLDCISNLDISNVLTDISRLLISELIKLKEQSYLMELICVFIDILGKKELYLLSHSFNVAHLAKEIGIALGYSDDKLRQLFFAALLHDIGKTMVDNEILNKVGDLTEEEYERIKEHPIYGEYIAKNLLKEDPRLEKVPLIIRHHHERYDGKGYPDGLKKEEVPFESYIIGITDAVDVMLMGRPYKKAFTLDNIIKKLYKNKGKQFHPLLVDLMVAKLSRAQTNIEKDKLFGINVSSLILNIKDQLNIIDGLLFNYNNYYVFKPFSNSEIFNIDLANITHVEMAVKGLNSLNYYEAKLEDFQNGLFYISYVKLVPSTNCFSLPWMLKGILYETKIAKEVPINIVKIGGDSMMFYVHTKKVEGHIHRGIPLTARIRFDEFYVDVTGIIIKSYNFGAFKYFDFQYTNIPDSKRDIIFRQLFRKQIELRKAIAKYS